MLVPKDFKGNIYIGTSGFFYDHWWNDVFYPKDIPKAKWLEYYADHFNTVEINSTFYRLPSPEVISGWYERTPDGFIFVLKGSRYITHIKRLSDCEESVMLFFERVKNLKEKLCLILWQFPPGFSRDTTRFAAFLHFLKNKSSLPNVFEFIKVTGIPADKKPSALTSYGPGTPESLISVK